MVAALGLSACANHGVDTGASLNFRAGPMRPYEVGGRRYEPHVYSHYDESGVASWYSYPAHTQRTADGEWFDAGALTAAHKTLPLPCIVEVTNLDNGRRVDVRVNDRGPFVPGRIIDLSRAAADRLGFAGHGTARVRVRLIGRPPEADASTTELAAADPDPISGLRGEH
jgi:rare lipoprotein A